MIYSHGQEIVSPSSVVGGKNGAGLAISPDGLVLAVGQIGIPNVLIYDLVNEVWTYRNALNTHSDVGSYGFSLSMNNNGSRLVVSNEFSDINGTDTGVVLTYSWNGSVWSAPIITTPIVPSEIGARFGRAVGMSDDGSVLFVTALLQDTSVGNGGALYVFDWNGSGWTQRGGRIDPTQAVLNQFFGTSGDISQDGTIIAAAFHSYNGVAGKAIITFDWNGSSWVQRSQVVEHPTGAPDTEITFANRIQLLNGKMYVTSTDHNNGMGLITVYEDSGDWGLVYETPLTDTQSHSIPTNKVVTVLTSDLSSGFIGYPNDDGGDNRGRVYELKIDEFVFDLNNDTDNIDFIVSAYDIGTGLLLYKGVGQNGINKIRLNVKKESIKVCVTPDTGGRVWEANKPYIIGDRIFDEGFIFDCSTAGTTGATKPSFDTIAGNTTTDNTVVWDTIDNIEQPIVKILHVE